MLSYFHARQHTGLGHCGRGSFGVTLTATLGALCLPHAAAAAEAELRVLHHQAVQLSSHALVGAQEHVTFEAYGRRFELSVAPNERIRRAMSADNTTTMPLQGTVDGVTNSWVRITRSKSGWRGIVFDGQSLYAIEPASDVAGTTVEPLTVSGSAPVVYRLDDALLPVDEMSCEVVEPDAPSTAAEAFQQISTELRVQAATAELAATKQVRVGIVGDFEFNNLFANSSTTADDAIIARMNIVDGIFTSQLGVKVSLAPLTLYRSTSDPFTRANANQLLEELKTFRGGSPAQLALGVTHLMTGRDLDGDTVGIAYIGSVCNGSFAASLSEGRRPTLQSALIAAHEIGHNFGAPHDGESGGACASTPQTFLMAPRLNGSDQFSACSLTQIQPRVNNAQCLTAYTPPDASIEIGNSSLQVTVGTPFVASFVVRSAGDDASSEVSVTATLPTSLTVNSVVANGGTCTNGAGTATCSLGSLAAGDTRQVDLNLTATATGSLNVALALASSNDANASNNNRSIAVTASGTPVQNPMPPVTGGGASSGGGGGGGRIDLALLALLMSASLLRARRVRPR